MQCVSCRWLSVAWPAQSESARLEDPVPGASCPPGQEHSRAALAAYAAHWHAGPVDNPGQAIPGAGLNRDPLSQPAAGYGPAGVPSETRASMCLAHGRSRFRVASISLSLGTRAVAASGSTKTRPLFISSELHYIHCAPKTCGMVRQQHQRALGSCV